jgi:hypothetical protein
MTPQPDPDVFRRRGEVVTRLAGDPLEAASRVWIEDGRLAELPDDGRGWTLRYGVRLSDVRGRDALLALAEDLVPLAVVTPPRGLVAEPTAGGVRLAWDPPDSATEHRYNVYRAPAGEPWPDRPLNERPLAATGHLDTTVATGRRYRYEVRVALAEGPPSRESAPSEARELIAEDRFPPSAPRGLVAVQEGAAVRLFWDPNPEVDLAGYRLFRRDPEGAWRAVGPEVLRDNTWLDTATPVGVTFAYRVTALDTGQPPNESAPSAEREVEIVALPGALP